MLTSIGRAAAAQRLLASGSKTTSLAAVTTSALAAARRNAAALSPTFAEPNARNFSTSQWVRLAAAAEGAKSATTKKTASKSSGAKATKTKKTNKATKPKPKPKPKKKAPKVLSPEEKRKKDIRDLKKDALLKEPKRLPETAWTIFTARGITTGVSDLGERIRALATEYKNLSSSELQRLQETAEENKLSNKSAYKSWVESHEPTVIYRANQARTSLREKLKAGDGPSARRVSAYRFSIPDERLPKRPQTAYNLFFKARWASGDFSGNVTDVAKQIGREFKDLSSSDKKPYQDEADADHSRYVKEVRSVLGREVGSKSSSP